MTRRHGRVLVVGVGGLGAPCARSLSDLGVARLVLVDPDVVDLSNLPRQLLYTEDDVGKPKAEVAAARLARPGLDVTAVVARFSVANASTLFAEVDVVVDGTDGAATKDLVHACAVWAGLPVVHAAALGSEARVLDVAAGGKPCLACLFGRAVAGSGADTCASFGVFPGVVRAAGECAAAAAWRLVDDPKAPTRGLRVLDLEAGRAVTLTVTVDPTCPLCGDPTMREGGALDMGSEDGRRGHATMRDGAGDVATVAPPGVIDLRDTACPLNLLRAKRAVAAVAPGATVSMWLGSEGAATVPLGLASLGHGIVSRAPMGDGLALVVMRRLAEPDGSAASVASVSGRDGSGDPGGVGGARWLERYARQIVLPGVGEAGQRRLSEAVVEVRGAGDAADACAEVLERAGAGRVRRGAGAPDAARDDVEVAVDRGEPNRMRLPHGGSGPLARARGALLADAAMRVLIGLPVPSLSPSSRGVATLTVVVRDDGTVGLG